MKTRLLLTTLATMMAVITIFAVPVKPGLKKKVTLSDGSVIELALRGDEHFSYYVNEKGLPCQVQEGELITMTADEVSKTWTAQKQKRLAVTTENGTVRRASRRAGTPSQATTGTHRGLVILMQFKDRKFVTKNPQTVFNDFFNKEGYNDGGMTGSVRDYFKAQSYGSLEINFDVVGPYTTTNNMAYYGKHQGKSNDANAAVMAGEAVDKAAADVNFSNYDWDKDGEVDQVFIIYAGYSEAQGAEENTIWPHEWYISQQSSSRKYNGVKIDKYGCASELMGDGLDGDDDPMLDGIGTACHEFSHCLGLPDMYDTDTSKDESNFGMSNWDVMDHGSYNNNSLTPAGYNSYERWFAGWLTPTEINSQTIVSDMRPLVEKEAKAYVLYNESMRDKGIEGEFYLLENRQPDGFDAALPGHGLLILHVDYNATAWWSNSVNVDADHQRVTIIPADNELDATGINLAGDPWPGTKGKTTLGNLTTPAATLYRNNTDGSKLMNKPITNITEDVAARTVSFMACYQEVEPVNADAIMAEAQGSNGFTITWPTVNDAVSYEVELITKGPNTPAKSLFYENDMKKCYSKNEGTQDISLSSVLLTKYGLESWQGDYLYTSPNYLLIGSSLMSGDALTPAFRPRSSGDVTALLGAKAKNGSVECTVYCLYAYEDDEFYSIGEYRVLSVSADAKQVVSFTDVPGDYFAVYIVPDAQMYLNYIALYDGVWTAEQLGVGNASQAPRRAAVSTSYTTTTTSYTFAGLDDERRYLYRVRAINNENVCSAWSEEKEFDFNTYTGIVPLSVKTAADDSAVRYFDLQGREVPADTKGLLIRKQGNEVKKVIVR